MDEYPEYDEYNDLDATSCANGDYNAWEENQVFLDHEGDDDEVGADDDYDGEYEPDLGVSDDNWACSTLDVD